MSIPGCERRDGQPPPTRLSTIPVTGIVIGKSLGSGMTALAPAWGAGTAARPMAAVTTAAEISADTRRHQLRRWVSCGPTEAPCPRLSALAGYDARHTGAYRKRGRVAMPGAPCPSGALKCANGANGRASTLKEAGVRHRAATLLAVGCR